jgi:uncharacterized membrane protein YdjX (TVP38/TMEM64 family)
MFGLTVGTANVSVGSTLGAGITFLIARYVAPDKVAQLAEGTRQFRAIDHCNRHVEE